VIRSVAAVALTMCYSQNLNELPACAGEAFVRVVPEKSPAGTALNPPLQCIDPDFGVLQYSVVSGNELGYFSLGASTGLFTASVLLPTTGFDTINVTAVVGVSDGVNTVEFNVTLSIQDIPLPPFYVPSEVRGIAL
jgi:hypothetical protein